jgi:hypothetical protein
MEMKTGKEFAVIIDGKVAGRVVGCDRLADVAPFIAGEMPTAAPEVFVVYDENASWVAAEVIAAVPGVRGSIALEVSEEDKSMDTVLLIVRSLLEAGASRKALLIAVGGGITTDLAGFAASIYKRGIRYANIPTTLLAQVDAAVGGKTGVNFDDYKNMLGVIVQPVFTFICAEALRTLPRRDFLSGAAELLKTFIIENEDDHYGRAVRWLTSGGSDAELQELLPRFTSGELLRITTLLQQTAAGFQRSANRRIDVELCLVQMCDPSLNLDAVSLNARLTRLEESLVSGQFVSAPQPSPAVSAPPEETLPPPQAEEPVSVPPEAASEPPCEELPVGFWADLVTRSKSDLEPSVRGYFPLSAQRNLEPRLNENVLEFVCVSDFVKGIVDTEKTRQVLSQKASAILMRPIQVRFVQKKSVIGGADDPMNQLLQLGRKRPDVIHIREGRK